MLAPTVIGVETDTTLSPFVTDSRLFSQPTGSSQATPLTSLFPIALRIFCYLDSGLQDFS